MTIVAVTADPNLSVALSLRNDLGRVRIVPDQEADPSTTDADAVAVIIDLTDDTPPDVVRRWRQMRPELPIILVGGAGTSFDLPLIHRLSRPFSLEGLASVLHDLAPAPEAEDDDRDAPWFRRLLSSLQSDHQHGPDSRSTDDVNDAAEQPTGERGARGGTGDAGPGTSGDPAPPSTPAGETPGTGKDDPTSTPAIDGVPAGTSETDIGSGTTQPADRTGPAAVDPDEAVKTLHRLVAETASGGRVELDPPASTHGPTRPQEGEDVRPMQPTPPTGDPSSLARSTVERIRTELGADTVIVWGRDDRCMYVLAAAGLSETERCVTLPLEHRIVRALETSASVSLPARDLMHAINGLPRLMSRPAHAVAIRNDGDLDGVVMVADPSLLPEDLHIVESVAADIWR